MASFDDMAAARPRRVVPVILLAAAAAAGMPAAASAQDADAAQPARLRPVTVEEQRPPDAYHLTDPAPTTRVTRDEFTQAPNDKASDILSRMPGVVVVGPPGEKKSISLRGMSPDFTRIEIDGVQLSSGGQGRAFELMNMSSLMVDTVTIQRNPTAEAEGDGIAGRVSIRTRALPERSFVEGFGALGDTDRMGTNNRQAGFSFGHRFNEGFGVLGALSYDDRTITKIKRYSERTFSGGPGGQGFLRDEDEPKNFINTDAMLNFGYRYAAGQLTVKPILLREQTALDKTRNQFRRVTGQAVDRTNTVGREKTELYGVSAAHDHEFGGGLYSGLEAAFSRNNFYTDNGDQTYSPQGAATGGSAENSRIRDTLGQLSAKLGRRFVWGIDQDLRGGVMWRGQRRNSDGDVYAVSATGVRSQGANELLRSRESDYRVTENYYAAFLLNEMRPTPRLTLTPGLRLEHVADDLYSGTGTSSSPSFTDLLPSLPVLYKLTQNVALHAAVARQVNRPRFDEMAPGITRRGPRSYAGDPSLNPARAWAFDAGVDYVGDDLSLGANAFYRNVRDIIEARELTANSYRFANVGNGFARGIELEQRLGFGWLGGDMLNPLTLTANQTFIDAQVNDPLTGWRRFADQPRFVANAMLAWNNAVTGTVLSVSGNYTGDRATVSYDGSGGVRRKTRDAELFVDLYAEQRLVPGLSVFAKAENLFGTDRSEIEYLAGRLDRVASIASGRQYYVGLNLRW